MYYGDTQPQLYIDDHTFEVAAPQLAEMVKPCRQVVSRALATDPTDSVNERVSPQCHWIRRSSVRAACPSHICRLRPNHLFVIAHALMSEFRSKRARSHQRLAPRRALRAGADVGNTRFDDEIR